jgi:hypothetical protein
MDESCMICSGRGCQQTITCQFVLRSFGAPITSRNLERIICKTVFLGSQPFWFERPALGLNLDTTIEKTYTREPSLKQLAFGSSRMSYSGNPTNACRFHRDGCHPTGLQPSSHGVQIFGERIEYSHGTLLTIRRHSCKNLTRSDINASGLGSRHGRSARHIPLRFFRRPSWASVFSLRDFPCFLLSDIARSFGYRQRPDRATKSTLWIGINLIQAVTTVWRTKSGAMLLIGVNCSTTDSTAYFRCLSLLPECPKRGPDRVPLSYGDRLKKVSTKSSTPSRHNARRPKPISRVKNILAGR